MTKNHGLSKGKKIHNFTVVRLLPPDMKVCINRRHRVRVRCICGNELNIPTYYLFRKQPEPKKHCGCLNKSLRTIYKAEYHIWQMMRRRCHDPKNIAYSDYGGRGIIVCEEWRPLETGFEKFLAFVGPRPSAKYSIERIDNDVGYMPYHPVTGEVQVKWATMKEQRANQRPYRYKSRASKSKDAAE